MPPKTRTQTLKDIEARRAAAQSEEGADSSTLGVGAPAPKKERKPMASSSKAVAAAPGETTTGAKIPSFLQPGPGNEIDDEPPETKFEDIAERAGLNVETLSGDMAAALLQMFKDRQKPWGQMLPGPQRDVAAGLDDAAQILVRRACILIARENRPTIDATLESFNTKDGIKITLKAPASAEALTSLLAALGKTVIITAPNFEAFTGQRAPHDIDQEQAEFPLGGPAGDTDLVSAADEAEEDEED